MVRLMAGLGHDIRLMLRPEWVDGVKLQMIWGLAPKPKVVLAHIKSLIWGGNVEWKGEQRLLQTGKTDLLLGSQTEKEKWGKTHNSTHREERENTDPRKLVIKPLAKHLKGRVWEDRLAQKLESWDGVEGVVSTGFSPDKHPEIARRGVVAFVVFETVEQRNSALEGEKVCYAPHLRHLTFSHIDALLTRWTARVVWIDIARVYIHRGVVRRRALRSLQLQVNTCPVLLCSARCVVLVCDVLIL